MAGRPPGRGYYFELAGNDDPAVAVTGYLIDDPDCYESFNVYDLIWRDPPVFPDQPPRLTRPSGRSRWFPCLALVQPGYDCSVVDTGVASAERVTELLAAVVHWAAGAGAASIAVLYAAGDALVAALSASTDWHRIRGTVRCQLDVPGGGTEAYLAGLSRPRRKQVRADLRNLAQTGVRTEVLPGSAAGEDELRLRMNLVAKYGGYSAADAQRGQLERLRSLFPDDRLWLFRSYVGDSRPLGFSLFIRHAAQWHSFWCGSEYQDPQSRWTYFDAMFYAPIQAAERAGIRLIDYGLGYERSKVTRGCRADPRDIWVTCPGGELDAELRFAAFRDARTGHDGMVTTS